MRHSVSLFARLACFAFASALALSAYAATITVTTAADDSTPGNNAVSLREAINAINNGSTADTDIINQSPGTFGTSDTINFNITPTGGVKTLTPASSLPPITKTVLIDGYTQAGASANTNVVGQGLNTVLTVELASANGLLQTTGASANGTVIRGLVLPSVAFLSANNKLQGSFVGTNAAGTAASGSGMGVVLGSSGNTIGGTTAGVRNLISGNGNAGVGFSVFTQDNNFIQGNLIGTNAAGTAAIPNGVGVATFGTTNFTTIGGADGGNVISGNTNGGILLDGTGMGTTIQSNFIGTNASGTGALGNGTGGILMQGSQVSALIGGSLAGAGNLISGNGQYGITLTTSNTVQGNRIGTNAAGTAALGTQTNGIAVFGNVNRIGGLAASEANIIAFNATGVSPGGIVVVAQTSGNSFVGNSIHDNGNTGGIVFGSPTLNLTTATPTLTSITLGSGMVTISGQVNAVVPPNTTFRLEFFSNVVCDTSGNGEGLTFLGAQTVVSNGTGQIPNFGPFTFAVPAGQTVFTATMTSNPQFLVPAVILPQGQPKGAVPAPETSKFSTCLAVAVASPPTITKSFTPTTIALNGTTSLSFTLTNPNVEVTLTNIGFVDTLPAGLVVSTPSVVTGACGNGTITATAGSNTISLSGVTGGPGASCTFSVNVTGTTAGVKNNSVTATSTEGGSSTPATASVTVLAPPSIAKQFGAASINVNGSTSLTFTVTNPNANTALTGVQFSDTLPAGLVVATPNGLTGSCGGGTITAVAGSGSVVLSSATLAAAAQCTFSVNVTGTTSGLKNNLTNAVTSVNGGTGNTASASVTVNNVTTPPTIAKSFGNGTLTVGGVTTLTFTLINGNAATALTGVGFTDPLPAGLVISTPNGLTGSCGGGTITAVAGTSTVTLSGATLAASASCTFSVNVTATGTGTQNNVTSAVTSTEGGSGGTATATVVIQTPAPANIPTLHEWALLLLAFILSGVAGHAVMRRRRGVI